jgi:hypothetical protein
VATKTTNKIPAHLGTLISASSLNNPHKEKLVFDLIDNTILDVKPG